MPTTATPVLDEQVLAQLAEELEDRHVLVGFLRRYLRLLDHRLHRIEDALTARDAEAWMDAVLSLKTASAMAGATALSQAAADLQDRVFPPSPGEHPWPGPEDRVRILEDLHGAAEATRVHLTLFLRCLAA